MTLFDQPIVKNELARVLQTKIMNGIGEGWTEFYKEADDIIYNICDQLLKNNTGKTVCPHSGDVMRAFAECKYSQTRVVFLLADPYHQVVNNRRVADGIPMSCSNTNILQPSLKLVYDEIERTVYPGGTYHRNPSLMDWCQQGVLLLNTALTVLQGQPSSHWDLWMEFTQFTLSKLSKQMPSLIWVLFGTNAKSFSSYISSGTKFTLSHPASAAYKNSEWNSDNLFVRINEILESRDQPKIIW